MVEEITEELGLGPSVSAYSVVDNMEFYTVYYGEGGYTVKEQVPEWLKSEIISKVKEYRGWN